MTHNHDDDFLTQLTEPPRPEFARTLAERLSRIEPGADRAFPRRFAGVPLNRRAVLAGAVAGGVALAAAGLALPFTGGSQTVSAEAILDRAQAVAANTAASPASYHLRATRRSGPGAVKGDVSANGNTAAIETWRKGTGYYRTEETVSAPNGAKTGHFGLVENPTQIWKFATANGQTHVGTVLKKPDANGNTPGAVDDQPMTLERLLALDGQKNCGQASRQADAVVLGRSVYVIAVTHRLCPDAAAKAGRAAVIPAQTINWVDKETFVLLKSEMRDAAGALIDAYEVSSIEFNVSIPDSMFNYTPPPGAIINPPAGSKPAPTAKP